ncbi:MAG: amino acid racemase [bacterium]|nr:amino acid racemase [bacterium]
MIQNKKTIGILGGMGPEATVCMFNNIVEMTDAKNDQEHIPIIIFNNPKIPRRTEAILKKGPSALPMMTESAKLLERAGADFIIVPCNTSHYYYEEVIKQINIPFLHLIKETVTYSLQKCVNLKRVGLLASSGTIEMRLYKSPFNDKGVECLSPPAELQECVMEAIYGEKGIKVGPQYRDYQVELIRRAIIELKNRNAEVIIAGCSEISLVLGKEELGIPVIDPMLVIAAAAIKEAGYRVVDR